MPVEHAHAIRLLEPSDGVMVSVISVPTDAALPYTLIVPVVVTVPPEIRPPELTVNPIPALAIVLSEADFSATADLKPATVSTSSETFARMV